MTLPADHPKRAEREDFVMVQFRCDSCRRPWLVFAFEGDLPEGSTDCRFCTCGNGVVERVER